MVMKRNMRWLWLDGANRLGGNGVADIVVNGRLAGIAAAQKVKDIK